MSILLIVVSKPIIDRFFPEENKIWDLSIVSYNLVASRCSLTVIGVLYLYGYKFLASCIAVTMGHTLVILVQTVKLNHAIGGAKAIAFQVGFCITNWNGLIVRIN